jgi:hypothetical protein
MSFSQEHLAQHVVKREVKDNKVILHAACGGQANGEMSKGVSEFDAEGIAYLMMAKHDKCDYVKALWAR